MSEEMREFALLKADEVNDLVAGELARRATRIELDVVSNDFQNVIMFFEFVGAEMNFKWNPKDRFNDPDMVYEIMLRMIYHAEDELPAEKSARKEEVKHSEPFGFVFAAEDEEVEEEEEDTGKVSDPGMIW
jgi:hypothetical protein